MYISGKQANINEQRRRVMNRIVLRRETEGKDQPPWHEMMIKLWTLAILMLLCFSLPIKTVRKTDGAGFTPANVAQNSVLYTELRH